MGILDLIINAIKSLVGGVMPRSHADVEALLDKREVDRPGLDWRNSIVDLLKLLDLDSSLEARKDLAEEIGIFNYTGTPEQNVNLHARTIEKIAHRKLG